MNVSSFDLNHARALHHLVEEAHVARAAKRLGITAAAASNALRRLRDEFDDELLVRQGRTLVRTPLAETLRLPARELLLAAHQLVTASARFEAMTDEGRFDLTMTDAMASVVLPALHRQFAARLPRACLQVRGISPDLATALRRSTHVAILPRATRDPALVIAPLFSDPFVCVLRRGHPLLRGPWSAKRLATAPHLVIESSEPEQLDDVFATRGWSRRVTRIVPTMALAAPLLATSDTVAMLPASVARALAPRWRLLERRLPFALRPVAIEMAWHLRHAADPRHVFFRELVRDAVHDANRR